MKRLLLLALLGLGSLMTLSHVSFAAATDAPEQIKPQACERAKTISPSLRLPKAAMDEFRGSQISCDKEGLYTCDNNNTCCPQTDGSFKCCTISAKATCCGDQGCCPEGYRCSTEEGVFICIKNPSLQKSEKSKKSN